MKYPVRLSEKSEQDLRAVYEYIACTLHSPMNAKTVFTRITEAVLSLEELPERHQVYKTGSRGEEIRFLVCGNHNIYYHFDQSSHCVNIIRILYGGMDIDSELDPWV